MNPVLGGVSSSSHGLPPRVSTSDESSGEKPVAKAKSTKVPMKRPAAKDDSLTDSEHLPLGGKGDDDDDEHDDSVSDSGIPHDLAPTGGAGAKKRPASAKSSRKKPSGKRTKHEDRSYHTKHSFMKN